jgi:AAA domain
MTPSPFRTFPFIENAFARRFQTMLSSARYNRSWHVLVADPGAGKTTCIRDLQKRAGGRSILAVVTPKNNDDEQALGDQIFAALGVTIRGHWSTRKPKLMGHLHQFGTECLVVDDAHDLSMPHLMFLKEVTDQGRLQYDHPLGLCLVAAGRGNTIPLKEILDQSEPTWLQWRRRLDPMQPFCRIAGHTSEEILEILATLETVFQPLLPQINLRQWTSSIYDWLTHSVLDPASSGRVSMDNLMKLVLAALEWSYEAKATDVQVEYLERAAALLVLRHDTFRIIDGEGPGTETDQVLETEKDTVSGVPAGQIAHPNEEQPSPLPPTEPVTQARSRKKEELQSATSGNCTFSGIVPIALQRFEQSGVSVVECPGCGRVWTLSPSCGVLRFKSHDKRKMNTPNTRRRWVRGERETDWDVVGRE